MRCCCFLPIIWPLNAVILLVLNTSVQCDVDVSLSTAEYYRLTGNWSLGGITLLKNGTATKEYLLIPECVHTITMKWHSLQQLQYASAKLQSGKPGVLPIVLTSVPQKGLAPISTDTISFEFRCNGSGDARVDVSIAVSNHDNIIHYLFSLTKRCGDCHNSSGIPGGSCDHLQCSNGGQCVSYNHTEVCACPSGYYGKHCEHAWCYPYCENGGYCVKPDKCQCPRHFTGNHCHIVICRPQCQNGGKCVGDGVCHCVRPYYGRHCKQKGYIQFIRKPKRRINVQQSSTAIITCIVKGTPAVEITWLKNGRKMSRDHHYSISHKYSNYALTSILQIYSIMATDKGRYTCLASNSIVSSKKHTYIKVKRLDISHVRTCHDPPMPSNGSFQSDGAVLTYLCEEGFTLVGNRQRFCSKTTYTWNGSDPTCEGLCTQDEPYSGSCDTVMSQYYYNAARDRCLPFDGCPATQAGHNSYNSVMNCRDTCMVSCTDVEGIERFHRAIWISSDCQVCSCVNGIISCVPVDCPILSCGGNKSTITIDGECCPVCPKVFNDGICEANNLTYSDGEVFMKDLCTTCQCDNATINCTSETCPTVNCASPVIDPSQCCPVCLPVLKSCELMANDPMTLTLFEVCNSVDPVVLHSCPERCVVDDVGNDDITNNDVIHCCITTYFTNSTQFLCANLPGVISSLHFVDANDCICEPCG